VVVTASQPQGTSDDAGSDVLLPIAIALVVVGMVGTLLYQWQNVGTSPAFTRRPLGRGPAPSSS
jgi:hypothetical protein